MGKLRFNYRSQTLSQNVDITVIIPTGDFSFFEPDSYTLTGVPTGPKKFVYKPGMKYQVIYMLHGGGDDDSVCYRKTNLERFADENQVMLVTPNLPNTFYADTAYGSDYSHFLTEELPEVINALFPVSTKREDTFIMGFAMGGNGALVTALKRPDLYNMCIDMSGGVPFNTDIEDTKTRIRENSWHLFSATFGDPDTLTGSKYDMGARAKQLMDDGVEVPVFKLYAGSEEGSVRDRVEKDAKNLAAMGYDVTYTEVPGYGHDWPLWNMLFEEVLYETIPLKRAPIYPEN